MKTRLNQFRERTGRTILQIEKEIELPNRELSRVMTTNDDEIPISIVVKILEKYDYLNPDWFLHGKGSMFRDENPLKGKQVKPEEVHPDVWEVLNVNSNSLLQRNGQLKKLTELLSDANDKKE